MSAIRRIAGALLAVLFLAVFLAAFYFRGARFAIAPVPDRIADVIKKPDAPIRLPDGFSVSIFAEGLSKPRDLIRDPAGTVLVSDPGAGAVRALPDDDHNGLADRALTVVDGMDRPHGLAFHCAGDRCTLFVAGEREVAAYEYDSSRRSASNKRRVLELPGGGNHTTRSLAVSGDRLLVSIGSTCNVCIEEHEWRAAVVSVGFDGSDPRIFARGLRNAPFLTLHPETGAIWATEMGRDFLGDDAPPDEINILSEGKNYGWPICYGKNIHDTDFDHNTYFRNPCMDPFETPSLIDLPAHSAPLGLSFIPKNGWPEEYAGDLLVAYHGSWNRSVPTGYKIVRVQFDENDTPAVEDFMTGWLTESGALGRPVDVLAEEGGVLYISDDKAGVVYRVVYQN